MSEGADQAGQQPAGGPGRRFSAFLSYSHADERFAKQLHRQLETYRLPHRLAVASGSARLKAIFRDSDELAAAFDLTTAVRDAIAQSDFLIVICSEDSAKSEWVGREIELFRSLHGDTGILAVIAEGDPDNAFHPALHGRTGVIEPLAADFSPNGGGKRLALLKLVAVLADVRLDELIHRDGQRRVRQTLLASGGALSTASVIAALAVVALAARTEADAQRNRASGLGAFMATDLRKGLQAAGRSDLLTQVDRAALRAYGDGNPSGLSPEQLEQHADFLQQTGRDQEKAGDLKGARESVDKAYSITARLVEARPVDPKRLFAHAQSEYWVGFVSWREGDGTAARAHFEAYSRLAEQLNRIDGSNYKSALERVYAAQNLGALALRQAGDPKQAERYFKTSLAEVRATRPPPKFEDDRRAEEQKILAWLADAQRLQGHLREAAATREEQRVILDQMLAKDPRDHGAKAQLLFHDLAVARIAEAQGDSGHAMSLYRAGYQEALTLASEDPTNNDYPKQARMFELFQDRLLLNLPQAQRAPLDQIGKNLGDCALRGPGADNREISDFCSVLRARLLARQNNHAGAVAALTVVKRRAPLTHDVLTARWGLDLAAEAGPIQLAQGGGR